MNSRETAYTVALMIGAAIVGWCAFQIFSDEHRLSIVECVVHVACPS
jgi:hypothetical protein